MRKPCCDKEVTNKGAWTKQEDQKLIHYIQTHGEGCWRSLPEAAGLHRCGKSCRLRWINYLKPDIKRGNFSQDEEDLIIKLHALLGNRWSLIAGRLPGRTDNDIKNYWNSHLRRKLVSMGIDPNNHRLNRTLPRSTQSEHVSFATTSSGSRKTTFRKLLKTPSGENDRPISDAASSIGDETCPRSDNLNLDLTIAFPFPMLELVEEKEESMECMMDREVENESLPTLLLFT